MAAPHSIASALRPHLRTVLGVVLLAIPLWLGLVHLPAPFSLEFLDAKPMVLDYAVRHGLGFGTELPTQVGPLGALLTPTHSGQPLWLNYWCQFFVGLVFALALAWTVWRASKPAGWWLLGFLLLVSGFRAEYLYLSLLVLGGMRLLVHPVRVAEAAGLGLVFGLLALIDVHFAWLTALAVLLSRTNPDPATTRITTLVTGGTLLLVIILGWIWTGQPFGDLLPWLAHGLLPTGLRYQAAAQAWPAATLLSGLVAVGLTLALLGGAAVKASRRRTALALGGFLLVLLAWVWRKTTGQPGAGAQALFATTLMVNLGWLVVGSALSALRWMKPTAMGAIATSLLGILTVEPRILTESIIQLNQKLVANATALGDRRGWQRSRNEAFRNSAQLFALPGIKSAIADHRTDLLGNALGYALVNQWNYSPRPGMQGYQVLDATLAAKNAAAYRGQAAPDFVVQRLQAFDHGLAAMEDAEAQLALYAGYDYRFEENGFVLWQRRTAAAEQTPLDNPVWQTHASWDQPVLLPVQPGHAYWIKIQVSRSAAGWLKKHLLFPADPTLVLHDAEGGALSYRADPTALATGFLINPLFRGEIDLVRYQAGEKLPLIRALTLQKPAGRAGDFAQAIELSLYAAPLPGVSGRRESADNLTARFSISNRLPVAISAYFPPQTVNTGTQTVLLAHPDSSLEFVVRAGDRGLQGRCGLLEGAYQNGNATDGVEFVAEFVPTHGPAVVLWRRQLDPLQRAEDRGLQSFSLAWPQPAEGRVVLRTRNLPGHNAAWDWSYWTDLRFESTPATP